MKMYQNIVKIVTEVSFFNRKFEIKDDAFWTF